MEYSDVDDLKMLIESRANQFATNQQKQNGASSGTPA